MITCRFWRRPVWLAGGVMAVVALTASSATAQTTSSPIALPPDEGLLWVTNPGADSVSIIDPATDRKLRDVRVGDEPHAVAIDPRNRYAFVANAAGNSVGVLRILDETPEDLEVMPDRRVGPNGQLVTGSEPWSAVVSPDGRRAFVANSGQDTLTVIDVRAAGGPRILGHVDLRRSLCNAPDRKNHFQPRGQRGQ
jgi:YVTN family beta-propeller protein